MPSVYFICKWTIAYIKCNKKNNMAGEIPFSNTKN
jgi:hypothetical protein